MSFQARRGSFDRNATAYASARPPYPRRVYDLLTGDCGLRPGARVLEIGPGTGQATTELLAAGAEVVAVEPGERMTALLRQRCGGERLQVVTADFEHAQLPAGPYDLAVSATAFHWVDPASALPKLAGLLAPGGWLVVWWNVFGDPEEVTPFRERLDRLYADLLPRERRPLRETPGPMRIDSWSAELRQGGWFGQVEAELIRWTHQLTAAGARRLWASFPNVEELSAPDRAEFLDWLAGIVTDLGGEVTEHYVTAIYRTRPAGHAASLDRA